MRRDSSNSGPPRPDPELESRLAEAHAAVLAREAARRAERLAPRAAPRAPAGWVAAASIAWLVLALVLLSPPRFLRGAEPKPFAPELADTEASLRYGVWLAQHRVAAFQAREGRLPSFLGETGVRDPAIALEVTGEKSYRLRASAGGITLEFRSGMAVDSFLGGSLDQLRAAD